MMAASPTHRVCTESSRVVSAISPRPPSLVWHRLQSVIQPRRHRLKSMPLPNILGHLQLRAVIDAFKFYFIHQSLYQFQSPTTPAGAIALISRALAKLTGNMLRHYTAARNSND